MAEMITLEARTRDGVGTSRSRRLRRQGLIPAVLYGKKLDNVHLAIDGEALERALKGHAHVLQIALPDGTSEAAVVREVQYDNVTDDVLHVDLTRVNLEDEVEIEVDLRLLGEPKGVAAGGHLETALRSLTIASRADAVPDAIKVDISGLGLDELLRVADLPLPAGVRALDDPDTVVVACRPAIEEAEAPVEEGPAEPELVTRARKEEESEEG